MKVYLLWHRTYNDNDERFIGLVAIYQSYETAENVRQRNCDYTSYFIEEWEVT